MRQDLLSIKFVVFTTALKFKALFYKLQTLYYKL